MGFWVDVLDVNNIKIDIVNYKHPWLSKIVEEDNYR